VKLVRQLSGSAVSTTPAARRHVVKDKRTYQWKEATCFAYRLASGLALP
jgi:hypothetical protein